MQPTSHRAASSALGRRGMLLLGALLVVPAGFLLLARSFPAFDPVFESPPFHVVVVSAIAAGALLVGLATGVAATRDRRSDQVLRAFGCVCVGFLMLSHGLTTPGMLGQPVNMWIGRLGTLALVGFAVCLGAALRDGGWTSRVIARAPVISMLVPTALLAVACIVIVVDPTVLSGTTPLPVEEQIRSVLLAASGFSLLLTGAAHWRRWRLGQD